MKRARTREQNIRMRLTTASQLMRYVLVANLPAVAVLILPAATSVVQPQSILAVSLFHSSPRAHGVS